MKHFQPKLIWLKDSRVYALLPKLSICAVILLVGMVGSVEAGNLHVMKTGLGEGTISGPGGISCGTAPGATTCNALGLSGDITVNITVPAGSRVRWGGDCATRSATDTSCMVNMGVNRRVRVDFERITRINPITDYSPGGIRTYLNNPANAGVDTPAEFVAALSQDFRENWILMPRSESLQTGTAKYPRILLVSADATRVFTIALDTHTSYPGADPRAIEYMEWNAADKNFHFHEIVLADIPAMDMISPGNFRFPARPRTPNPVSEDDFKCFSCHSTRNVKHDGRASSPGTTGVNPPFNAVPWKNKPNWDTYDSWGGMLAFNRDRIFQNSVEAAAFRKTFNLWTWQDNPKVRAVIEQLRLQPDGVPEEDVITRWDEPPLAGGDNDGHIEFAFDPDPPTVVTQEPQPTGTDVNVTYEFNRRTGPTNLDNIRRSDVYVRLHHSCQPSSDEGRGVELFDRLTNGRPRTDRTTAGNPACPPRPNPPLPGPNALRIADELATHPVATGNVRIDVRPIALAIASSCFTVSGDPETTATQRISGGALTPAAITFFDARNGMDFNGVHDDTRRREQSLTRRKGDIARTTYDRDTDLYAYDPNPFDATPLADTADRVDGLIREFGDRTLGIQGGTGGTDRGLQRLRQEVFRRSLAPGHADETVMGGHYADREDDSTPGSTGNHTPLVAQYRYFLEPLGISVDKWSMGVRGRSRTYTFADVFSGYPDTIKNVLSSSLGFPSPPSCMVINPLVTTEFNRLTTFPEVPTYTDIQRIFNKNCIECHDDSIMYPPYRSYAFSGLDLSENEDPPMGQRRLWRSLDFARRIIGQPACAANIPLCALGTGTDVSNSYLYSRITDNGNLRHPYEPGVPFNTTDPDMAPVDIADERCPGGLMPCEGPPLSKVDIETFRRWIIGGRPNTEGDPHIRTVDGVHYDFQSAGEFILLRGEGLELQARHTPVTTAGPVGPNQHTGLTSCVSINTAVALRVGLNRITLQPDITVVGIEGNKVKAPPRLRLRVDGKDVTLGPDGFALSSGGRIVRTSVAEGIEIHVPGGEGIVITPAFWDYYQVWYMNIEVRHSRSTEGVMGTIAPDNWLPALANGDLLGSKPKDLGLVYRDLNETFANSWRVDTTTSLFDYETGLGLKPQSFVVKGWPGAGAQQCVAPPMPGGPVARPAPAPIARAQAEQLCHGVADPARRDNCIMDVMATGEGGFASAYKDSERLERRVMLAPPVLVAPANNVRVPGTRIDFQWKPFPGTEGIDVTYRHCIWHADEVYDLNRCVKLPEGAGAQSGIGEVLLELKPYYWIVVLIALVLLLITFLLIRRYGKRGIVLAVLLATIVVVFLLAILRMQSTAPPAIRNDITGLLPNKVYFWKVVTETREGVIVESATQRIEVTP